MPILSCFYGVVIEMRWKDHNPPHFHAKYNELEAVVRIIGNKDHTIITRVIQSTLPSKLLRLVLEWAEEHKQELLEDWNLCQQMQRPKQILPIE